MWGDADFEQWALVAATRLNPDSYPCSQYQQIGKQYETTSPIATSSSYGESGDHV
jgi:hypothetical protein